MQKKILIVDFEQRAVEEIQEILRSEDYTVLTAADGSEAIGVFQASPPDLVLATALLPRLNGFELCKKITSGELGEVRPVIMYSAIYKAEKYRKEAVSGCGALEFLDTPIPKWQLLKAVKAAFTVVPIGERELAGQLTQPAIAGAEDSILALDEPETRAADESGDLLEVNPLFDTLELPDATTPVLSQRSVLMPSIENFEIDAAMDSVRIDLDQEVRYRDELLARQVEQELMEEGHSVLEFEGTLQEHSTDRDQRPPEHSTQDFELDEVLPELEAVPASSPPPSDDGEDSPSFSIAPAETRNWLPFAILIGVLVLAGLVFWIRS